MDLWMKGREKGREESRKDGWMEAREKGKKEGWADDEWLTEKRDRGRKGTSRSRLV